MTRRLATALAVIILFVAVLAMVQFSGRPVSAAPLAPIYKIVESPGREPVAQYEKVLNDMAAQGYEFQGWLFRGSAQTPDMIFRKR